ncbi:MAG: large conductance mechanosensitive channel protein MscL [Actinomycetales bacterium]|nr:large conductance mechanosensitive channel protein MscL [Actinomycetales bacterium]
MFKGFKEFILRGNVIDLAVAVVIGAAFTAIVNAIVTGVFNPLIALIFDSSSLTKAGVILRAGSGDTPDLVLSWGLVLSALIQFLLVATVVYFAVVYPMNLFKRRAEERKKAENPEDPSPALPTELEVLTEIRDLLKAERSAG